MKSNKRIIYLGCSGFPYGLAEVQKIILISKSLVLEGNDVTVICKRGVHDKNRHSNLKSFGKYQGIDYIYTPGTPFRNERFVIRNLLKIKGVIKEIVLLHKMQKNRRIDYAILSTHSFSAILYYYLLSKLYKFKTVLNYVEYSSGIKKKWNEIDKKINDKLFDKFAPHLTSASFVISDFLIDHIRKVSPNKKYLKIPGLTDFEKYAEVEILKKEKYFLFCGSTAYKEIIQFCIDSFSLLDSDESFFLYLVINGTEGDMIEVRDHVNNHPKKDKIRIFSKLTEKQLYTHYKNAVALLIPLRPTLQDVARFPHKTGEYMGSGNPVISTNYGEIKNYFKDMDNILLADTYDINRFADKMQFVVNNPELAKKIGENGRNIANTLFHYPNRAAVINNFLETEL